MTTEATPIVLEEDPAVLVPAELALLELLKGHGEMSCSCKDENNRPIMLQVKLGEAEGPHGARVLAAVWKHDNEHGESHWRREVPLRFAAEFNVNF